MTKNTKSPKRRVPPAQRMDARDSPNEQARLGELTDKPAEAEAVKLGMKPFAAEPERAAVMANWQPPLVRPEGIGYMSIFCAVYWIATKGGTENFNLCDTLILEQAYSQLLPRISSDDVAITGVRDGEREKIGGYVFADIGVEYPWSDTTLSDDLYLSNELYFHAGAYLDEVHWRDGSDDKLQSRRGVKWGKLLVLNSDVARWWPFDRKEVPGKGKAGAKKKYDWKDVELFVTKTLNEKDDFLDDDTTDDWKSQNDLLRLVAAYMGRTDEDNVPGESGLKENVAPMVARWRAKQAAGN